MGRLVLRRLGATVPVLILVTAGVFALLHLTPGDPIDVMMAESVDATVKENLRRELGLDRPVYVQYAAWMGRLLRGDLGRSIRNGEPAIPSVSRWLRWARGRCARACSRCWPRTTCARPAPRGSRSGGSSGPTF